MVKIIHQGQRYSINTGESVLDALLRQGVNIPSGCRTGVCNTCIMKTETGKVTTQSQQGLKETLKAQGYFLPCVCHPEEDLYLAKVGNELQKTATITELAQLSEDVIKVEMICNEEFDYYPGQFILLIRQDGLSRSYSLASLPKDGKLELHVRIIPNGRMSGWLYKDVAPGESVRVQGPIGECFYLSGRPEQPMLLVGTGTGLAPLYGILRDALAQGHQGPIWLFHGALTVKGLYLTEELRALVEQYPQFHYCPSVLKADDNNASSSDIEVGTIDKIVLKQFTKLTGWRAFLCGHPEIVNLLKKRFFLAGISLKDIHADAFLPSGT